MGAVAGSKKQMGEKKPLTNYDLRGKKYGRKKYERKSNLIWEKKTIKVPKGTRKAVKERGTSNLGRI